MCIRDRVQDAHKLVINLIKTIKWNTEKDSGAWTIVQEHLLSKARVKQIEQGHQVDGWLLVLHARLVVRALIFLQSPDSV